MRYRYRLPRNRDREGQRQRADTGYKPGSVHTAENEVTIEAPATQHGQDVRILDVKVSPAAEVLFRTGDFWVLEHQHVVVCRYDREGRPLGTVAVDAAGAGGFLAAAELAWRVATPFTEWWNAHPQFHRTSGRAAY